MEESIGYEAFFSPEEWDSLDLFDGDELGLGDVSPEGETVEGSHTCTIYDPPGEVVGNESKFEVECERCGVIGSADDEIEARAISALHEQFVATLVDKWDIDRLLKVRKHQAFIAAENGHFEIICSHCGDVGSANDRASARLLKRFHDSAFELASKAVSR